MSIDYGSEKVVPSTLYTTEAAELQKEVEQDLEIPDPDPEAAQAAIADSEISDN